MIYNNRELKREYRPECIFKSLIMKGTMPIAIYHFNVKVVSRSKGTSAAAKAAYISGEKIKNEYDGVTHDYRKKGEIVHKEILLPYGAPAKFRNRTVLWNAVESAETRKNSQTAKHIDAALPVEITRDEQIDLSPSVYQCSSQLQKALPP